MRMSVYHNLQKKIKKNYFRLQSGEETHPNMKTFLFWCTLSIILFGKHFINKQQKLKIKRKKRIEKHNKFIVIMMI